MNQWLPAVTVLVLSLCIVSACVSLWSVRRVVTERLANRAARDLEARIIDLEEAAESMRVSLKKLHSRAGMRELREKRALTDSSQETPDWRTDPEAFRAAARRQHLLNGRGVPHSD